MGNRHVIPNLIEKVWKLSNQESLKIFNPSHVRSFCHIDDAVEQILYLIENDKVGTFNIGNPNEPINMSELAKLLLIKLKRTNDVLSFSETKGSPSYRKPQIDYIEKNYIKLDDGLDEMVTAFKMSQSW
jgi:UDP-glucuronate decarboxylase